MNEQEKDQKNPFQDTLNLPHTDFSIRAQAATTEPAILERWIKDGVYDQVQQANKGNKQFILHDGPPYANGHIHLGTALNKSLKDFVTKSKRMAGFHVPYVLGWDCHGLPIELKVTTEQGIENKRESIDPITFKGLCREYANKWIEVQKGEFRDLGVMGDPRNPYITMNPGYEGATLRAFAQFVDKGYIERKGKTVPWCGSCQTVLAGAEIEHAERKDPSCYILFKLDGHAAKLQFPFLMEKHPDLEVNFLVWTTTPWTIPLNRAVVLNDDAIYVVLQGRAPNEAFIVAKSLADQVCQTIGLPRVELCEFDSIALKGTLAHHPLTNVHVPVILDGSVLLSDGTACVHSAPGCGPEDYLLGLKHNLEIYSPISPDAKYTALIVPHELAGTPVADGQFWVLKKLAELNRLMFKSNIKHSYPHCWRCRNGLIFRATDQWFCSLQKNDLVQEAVKATEKINFVPSWGKNRLQAFVQTRTEWCISRQRQWGVPITAVLCNACDQAFLNAAFINAVAARVEKEGIEFWDRMTPTELVALGILSDNFICPCGNNDYKKMRLERDILDVWFDSGVSNYAVLQLDDRLNFPADMYLEGSDQHRGWFQSSMFCSLVVNEKPYADTILTHGFVVDENKRKMSKSIGNVIAPQDVIKQYSRDILRLWVASSDYEGDIVISEKLLKNVAEVYRKVRNTCRFMISNLYDFDFEADRVPSSQLWAMDQYILAKLESINDQARAAYDQFRFLDVVQILNNFCANDLSGVYLDIVKDRLYTEQSTGAPRRSAQTAIYVVLDQLTHLMAPILSFLAEEVSDFYMKDKKGSIHTRAFPHLPSIWADMSNEAMKRIAPHHFPVGEQNASAVPYKVAMLGAWEKMEELRGAVLKALEELRQAGTIKHSLESQVTLRFDQASEAYQALSVIFADAAEKEGIDRLLRDWLISSQVTIIQDGGDLKKTALPWLALSVEHAAGNKCPRCWQWSVEGDGRGLCSRCAPLVK